MPLGSAQPLTEIGTRNLPGGKGQPAYNANNLTAIYDPRRLTTLWDSAACYMDNFTRMATSKIHFRKR
jgi:hypothetical protein